MSHGPERMRFSLTRHKIEIKVELNVLLAQAEDVSTPLKGVL